MANARITLERANSHHPNCDYIGFSPGANTTPEHDKFLGFLAATSRTFEDVTSDPTRRPTAAMIASRIGAIVPPLNEAQIETFGRMCVGDRAEHGLPRVILAKGIVDAGPNIAIFQEIPGGLRLVGA